jgi:hypothetical protein
MEYSEDHWPKETPRFHFLIPICHIVGLNFVAVDSTVRRLIGRSNRSKDCILQHVNLSLCSSQ